MSDPLDPARLSSIRNRVKWLRDMGLAREPVPQDLAWLLAEVERLQTERDELWTTIVPNWRTSSEEPWTAAMIQRVAEAHRVDSELLDAAEAEKERLHALNQALQAEADRSHELANHNFAVANKWEAQAKAGPGAVPVTALRQLIQQVRAEAEERVRRMTPFTFGGERDGDMLDEDIERQFTVAQCQQELIDRVEQLCLAAEGRRPERRDR